MNIKKGFRRIGKVKVEGRVVSTNRIWRYGKGHHYKIKKARELQKKIRDAIIPLRERSGLEEYGVEILARVKGRKPDVDNVLKVILDGIAEGLDVDDSRFRFCGVRLEDGRKDEIIIELYGREGNG